MSMRSTYIERLTRNTFRANQLIPNSRSFWYDGRNRLFRATGRKHATVNAAKALWHNAVLHYKDNRLDLYNGTKAEAGTFTDPTTGDWTYDENGNTLHTPRHKELRYTLDSQPKYDSPVDTPDEPLTDGDLNLMRGGLWYALRIDYQETGVNEVENEWKGIAYIKLFDPSSKKEHSVYRSTNPFVNQ